MKQGDFNSITETRTSLKTRNHKQHGHNKWNRQSNMMMNSNNSESSGHWALQGFKWEIMWQNTINMIWMKQHNHETEHRP